MYSEFFVKPNTQKFIAQLFVRKMVAAADAEGAADTLLGTAATGLTSSSWSKIAYVRAGATGDVPVTLAVGALGTWSSGGFILVDDTDAPGLYQFGVPNAAIVSGVPYVDFVFVAATDAQYASTHFRIHLIRSLAS
jgi:hypothetical protein